MCEVVFDVMRDGVCVIFVCDVVCNVVCLMLCVVVELLLR